MFCNSHNRQPGRVYCRFSNMCQYQLTQRWSHDLDMFSAVVAFVRAQFMKLIMRAGSVMRTFGGSWSLEWTSCWTNSRIAGDLRRNVTNLSSVSWPWPWHPKSWRPGARRFRLRVCDIQTKWITLHFMTKPTVSFYIGAHGFIQYSPGPRLSPCDENC